MGEEGDGLYSLAQTHLIRQDPVQAPLIHRDQPVQTHVLVLTQRELKKERNRRYHARGLEGVTWGTEEVETGRDEGWKKSKCCFMFSMRESSVNSKIYVVTKNCGCFEVGYDFSVATYKEFSWKHKIYDLMLDTDLNLQH